MYPLMVTIASLLCRICRIRSIWSHGNKPFLFGVPIHPLMVTIASLLCRICRIRSIWSQLVMTRTYCWLACREDRHTFPFVWKCRLIHVGHYQWLQNNCIELRFQSFWNKPTNVVSTFEWILFNLRFRMFCTNLIVTARNRKLFIIQTKQCCCCRYFWMKCRQQNQDTCVKWIHIKDCFRVILILCRVKPSGGQLPPKNAWLLASDPLWQVACCPQLYCFEQLELSVHRSHPGLTVSRPATRLNLFCWRHFI